MVKHPQSLIGYARDGVVYKRPSRQQDGAVPSKNNGGKKRNKNARPRKTANSVFFQRVRFHPGLIRVKNAVKQGRLDPALEHAYDMSFSMVPVASPQVRFRTMVQILFAPDIENRSSIYYAAHAGHSMVVKVLLSYLIVMIKSKRRHFGEERFSFKSWLKYFGYPSCFGPSDLSLCVLNALNTEVQNVFLKEKFNMEEILGFVSPESETIASIVRQVCIQKQTPHNATPKKCLPRLNVEDELYAVDEDIYSTDYSSDEEDRHEGTSFKEEEVEGQSVSALQDLSIEEETAEDLESVTIHDDDTSYVQVDDGSELNLALCAVYVGESDWELMSETSSVVTFSSDTLSESYAEILLRGTDSSVSSHPLNFHGFPLPRYLQTIQDTKPRKNRLHGDGCANGDEEGTLLDAHFFVDGVKGSRGGHRSTMFKGNSRTSKHYRCGRNWKR